jgi:hypothetical protein
VVSNCQVIFRLCGTYRKTGKGKRHNAVCDHAALNKTSKNNQASIRPNNRINLKEGESSSVCFGHMKTSVTATKDTSKNEEASMIIHKTHV